MCEHMRRGISQIVVSLLLLSVAVVVTATTGSTLMRMLSFYRPSSDILVRVGDPSLDIDVSGGMYYLFKVSVNILNMGSIQLQVQDGSVYVLFRGTTGTSRIQTCWLSNAPIIIPPGSTATVQATCPLTTAQVTELFGSSWTGDIMRRNTYFLFMRLHFTAAPGEEFYRELPGIVF